LLKIENLEYRKGNWMIMRIVIVLPTYNERENIKVLIPEIFKIFKENKIDGKVIVVDDSSPDGTSNVVEKLKEKNKEKFIINLIKRDKKLGLGSAYIYAFRYILNNPNDIPDVIFEMDADLSHSPDEIPKFLEKFSEGYDVVIGSRRIKGGKIIGWNKTRKFISLVGNFIGKYLAGIYVSDLTSGYRAYKREVLEKISLKNVESDGYAFQLEMLARAKNKGFKIGTVPITFYDRISGKSKLSRKDLINFLLIAFKIRFNLLKK